MWVTKSSYLVCVCVCGGGGGGGGGFYQSVPYLIWFILLNIYIYIYFISSVSTGIWYNSSNLWNADSIYFLFCSQPTESKNSVNVMRCGYCDWFYTVKWNYAMCHHEIGLSIAQYWLLSCLIILIARHKSMSCSSNISYGRRINHTSISNPTQMLMLL